MTQQIYVAITKSDTTVYAPALSWIWVGTTGDVAVVGGNGLGGVDTVATVLHSVPAGDWIQLPYPVVQIMSTGTTASNIVGAATG